MGASRHAEGTKPQPLTPPYPPAPQPPARFSSIALPIFIWRCCPLYVGAARNWPARLCRGRHAQERKPAAGVGDRGEDGGGHRGDEGGRESRKVGTRTMRWRSGVGRAGLAAASKRTVHYRRPPWRLRARGAPPDAFTCI